MVKKTQPERRNAEIPTTCICKATRPACVGNRPSFASSNTIRSGQAHSGTKGPLCKRVNQDGRLLGVRLRRPLRLVIRFILPSRSTYSTCLFFLLRPTQRHTALESLVSVAHEEFRNLRENQEEQQLYHQPKKVIAVAISVLNLTISGSHERAVFGRVYVLLSPSKARPKSGS